MADHDEVFTQEFRREWQAVWLRAEYDMYVTRLRTFAREARVMSFDEYRLSLARHRVSEARRQLRHAEDQVRTLEGELGE
jgi:hypothetical protein